LGMPSSRFQAARLSYVDSYWLFTAPATVALRSDLTITVQHAQKVMVAKVPVPVLMLDSPDSRIHLVCKAPEA
jgi:hypothetical protein